MFLPSKVNSLLNISQGCDSPEKPATSEYAKHLSFLMCSKGMVSSSSFTYPMRFIHSLHWLWNSVYPLGVLLYLFHIIGHLQPIKSCKQICQVHVTYQLWNVFLRLGLIQGQGWRFGDHRNFLYWIVYRLFKRKFYKYYRPHAQNPV